MTRGERERRRRREGVIVAPWIVGAGGSQGRGRIVFCLRRFERGFCK